MQMAELPAFQVGHETLHAYSTCCHCKCHQISKWVLTLETNRLCTLPLLAACVRPALLARLGLWQIGQSQQCFESEARRTVRGKETIRTRASALIWNITLFPLAANITPQSDHAKYNVALTAQMRLSICSPFCPCKQTERGTQNGPVCYAGPGWSVYTRQKVCILGRVVSRGLDYFKFGLHQRAARLSIPSRKLLATREQGAALRNITKTSCSTRAPNTRAANLQGAMALLDLVIAASQPPDCNSQPASA